MSTSLQNPIRPPKRQKLKPKLPRPKPTTTPVTPLYHLTHNNLKQEPGPAQQRTPKSHAEQQHTQANLRWKNSRASEAREYRRFLEIFCLLKTKLSTSARISNIPDFDNAAAFWQLSGSASDRFRQDNETRHGAEYRRPVPIYVALALWYCVATENFLRSFW